MEREIVFQSLAALGRHAQSVARRVGRVDRLGRSIVGEYFAREAKARVGKRNLLLPFLKEATQRERVRLGYTADETLLRDGKHIRDTIGWSHPSSDRTEIGSNDDVAVAHELGVPKKNIPKRSFLASTARESNDSGFRKYAEAIRLGLLE